jgi:hypothetical protein
MRHVHLTSLMAAYFRRSSKCTEHHLKCSRHTVLLIEGQVSMAFDSERDGVASAQTQGGDAALEITTLQFV